MWTRRTWLALAASGGLCGEDIQGWNPVLALDEPDSFWQLNDVCFVTARMGLAGGTAVAKLDRSSRNLLWHSEDGGRTWVSRKAPAEPLAFFTLGESHVWMLAGGRAWFSSDAGWQWRQLGSAGGAARLFFLDHRRGFAFGQGRRVATTINGGASWSPLPAAGQALFPREMEWRVARSSNSGEGWIAGRADLPLPEDARGPGGETLTRAQRRRLRRPMLALLRTADGGARWEPELLPAPGDLDDLIESGGQLTAAFDLGEYSRYPSVVAAARGRGEWATLLREENLQAQSLLRHEGELLVAGHSAGKARVAARDAAGQWRAPRVHYSAESRDVRFFAGPRGMPWLRLASGMILAPVR